MVFELVDDLWVCVETNPDHPVIQEREATKHMREMR